MTIPGYCPRCLQWLRSKAHYGAHIRWSPQCRLTPAEVIDRYVPERPDDPAACWLWKGAAKLSPVSGLWYGALSYEGRHWQAHRFVYHHTEGPIPPKHDLDHMCNQSDCVRPSHLLPVTAREHFARRVVKADPLRDLPVPW